MPQHLFEIFIDGGCSLCSREAGLLRRLDRGRGRLKLTDLASPEFERSDHGLSYEQVMRSIHGMTPDGRVVHGVEVFRRAYEAVGLGWLWAPTGWPVLRPLADEVYRAFARWRFARRVRQGCGLQRPASPHHHAEPRVSQTP